MKKIKRTVLWLTLAVILGALGIFATACSHTPEEMGTWYMDKVRVKKEFAQTYNDRVPWVDYSEEQDGSGMFFLGQLGLDV